MDTNNTYNFNNITEIDDLINEAFQMLGYKNEITGLEIKSAIFSANLELSSWVNKGVNLFMVEPIMLQIYAGQSKYQLPPNVSNIPYNEMIAFIPQRLNQGGIAYSSEGGDADNCFNPLLSDGCVQDSPNGYIYYDYGENLPKSLLYVGVLSLYEEFYTLNIEYSLDGNNWNTLQQVSKQKYFTTIINWIPLKKTVSAQYWRIREVGNSTLKINQIYFSASKVINSTSYNLSSMSRSDYLASYMNVNSVANTFNVPGVSATSYYLEQGVERVLNLYPVPKNSDYVVLFSANCYVTDVVYLFKNVGLPQKFLDAFVKGVAARLALKFAPDKLQILKAEAEEAYAVVSASDVQNVDFSLMPSLSQYF